MGCYMHIKTEENKNMYCSFEFFMKNNCNGCKLGRECDAWNEKNNKNKFGIKNKKTSLNIDRELITDSINNRNRK